MSVNHALTRDAILSGQFAETLRARDPDLPFLTDSALRRSRDSFLQMRPAGPLRVFAYGSLIWNPTFEYLDRCVGRLFGYHTSFCLRTHIGRGTPEVPALMLGLEAGGSCNGLVYLIAEEAVETETWALWRREMLLGTYHPRWVTVMEGGETHPALAFVINDQHEMYAGGLSREQVVSSLATARGEFGPACEYLMKTVEVFAELKIKAPTLNAIARDVREKCAARE